MLSEIEFKKVLIKKLNINSKWRDGDLDNSPGKKVDVVNDFLKIAIEIKDDTLLKIPIPKPGELIVSDINITQKNRQFKDDLKSASKKFLNYPGYKTIVLIRTEMADRSNGTIDYTISGPYTLKKINGELIDAGRPSSYFNYSDNSINEVGAIIFWGNYKYLFADNTNPNVNTKRIIKKSEAEKIFNIKFL